MIPVCNEELFTIREAMRGLNRMVADLEDGRLEKVVLTKGGKMCAVVLALTAYEVPKETE